MTFRSIVKEDLSKLAKLADNQELCTMEDLCLEHSKMCLDDNGKVLAFVVIRQNSLIDYCGGQIPADESVNKNDEDYEEGDEYHLREDVAEFKKEEQYEIVSWYLRQGEDYMFTLRPTYLEASCWCSVENRPIGVIWMPYKPNSDIPIRTCFYNLNDLVWVDAPIKDY